MPYPPHFYDTITCHFSYISKQFVNIVDDIVKCNHKLNKYRYMFIYIYKYIIIVGVCCCCCCYLPETINLAYVD